MHLTNHHRFSLATGGGHGLCWLENGRGSRRGSVAAQVISLPRPLVERSPPRPTRPQQQQDEPFRVEPALLFSAPHSSVDDAPRDYSVSRQCMDELERLSAELLANLHELNAACEAASEEAAYAAAAHALQSSPREGSRHKRSASQATKSIQPDAQQQQSEPLPQLLKPGRPNATPHAHYNKLRAKRTRVEGAAVQLPAQGKGDATKLLTRQDEIELAEIVKDALMLEKVRGRLQQILKRPPSNSEWAKAVGMDDPTVFAARLRMGQTAKASMLSYNKGWVHHVCKSYQNRGVDVEDLFTAGMQGLLAGVERFDGEKGIRLATYSYWWIRQALNKCIDHQGRIIRLPDHVTLEARHVYNTGKQMSEELEREPSLGELAARLDITPERITMLRRMHSETGSLDVQIGSDKSDRKEELSGSLQDDRANPDASMDSEMLQRDLQDMLNSGLEEREATVVKMRLLLGLTFPEIARRVGLSAERVRQIERRAVARLRKLRSGKASEYGSQQAAQVTVARSSRGTFKT